MGARPVGWDCRVGLGAQLTAVRELARGAEEDGFTATATLEISLPGGSVRVELDTSGAIDVVAERAQLGKHLAGRCCLEQSPLILTGNLAERTASITELHGVDTADG